MNGKAERQKAEGMIAQRCYGETDGPSCGMWPTHDWEAAPVFTVRPYDWALSHAQQHQVKLKSFLGRKQRTAAVTLFAKNRGNEEVACQNKRQKLKSEHRQQDVVFKTPIMGTFDVGCSLIEFIFIIEI